MTLDIAAGTADDTPSGAGSSDIKDGPAPTPPVLVAAPATAPEARFAAGLVPALPERTAWWLRRRLGHSLAAPSPAALRESQLGLLRELVSEQTGEVPSVELYEQARAARAAASDHESWPTASTLSRAYGGWVPAVEQALRMHFYGTPARVPGSFAHAPAEPVYRHDEVIAGLAACREALGAWPTASEYYEYARVARRAARHAGSKPPRLASRTSLERVCGSWERALSLAQRTYDDIDGRECPDGLDADVASTQTPHAPSQLPAPGPQLDDQPRDQASELPPTDADRLARQLWAQLRTLGSDDRQLVFEALSKRLVGELTPRKQQVIDALERCAQDLPDGQSLSRRAYDDWRNSQDEPNAVPSATYIRNTFHGSWSKALDLIGATATPDILSRRLTGSGGRYTREEMLSALRECATALDTTQLTFAQYRKWADAEVSASDRTRRLPLSHITFSREFGSWAETRAAAGLGQPSGAAATRGTDRSYDPERLVALVRLAADDLAVGGALTTAQYEAWRNARLADAAARGEVAMLATAPTISHRIGSWATALHEAGLLTDQQYARRRHRAARDFADDALRAALADALRDGGGSLTRAGYERWREERLRAGGPSGPAFPSVTALENRFGGWRTALAAAQELVGPARPDEERPADF